MKGCKSWLLVVSLCAPLAAQAAEPESCGSVRFADVGWTDITVTTAVTRQVLESLGYKTRVNLLSVPVTYRSLANNDLDVFLGNWMPTMTNDIKQYAEKGTVETLRAQALGAGRCGAARQRAATDGLDVDEASTEGDFLLARHGIPGGLPGQRRGHLRQQDAGTEGGAPETGTTGEAMGGGARHGNSFNCTPVRTGRSVRRVTGAEWAERLGEVVAGDEMVGSPPSPVNARPGISDPS
ncbi:hypothetical protein G039_0329695 [Pseudomonas aeruginosa VRFPA01]|nr:hypothetical protein G039_0329695 [Pseudomonas aeruginosa VRFPA01]